VANSKGLSPAQVVLKWHLQRGLTPVAKTTSTRRLKENLSSKESPDLTANEMDVLASLDRQSSCDFTGFTSPDRIA
jgi:diketogulonate reductase-like aldo/keto reductase